MKLSKPYRGQRASKRLDLSDLKELLRDRRVWCGIGIATVPAGEASHFFVADDDVLVDVVLQPSLLDVTCRLAAGMWLVPAVGEEVAVIIPEGAIEFMPAIVAILSTGKVPTDQAPTPERIVIVRSEVVVHDGDGGAEPLPTLASVRASIDALRDALTGLTMPVVGGGGGTVGPPTGISIPEVDGTTVLKAK